MRCSRCGNSFVGSSVEEAGETAPQMPPPGARGPRLSARRQPAGSNPTVMMAVLSFFGIVAVIALVAVLVVRLRSESADTGPAARSATSAPGRTPRALDQPRSMAPEDSRTAQEPAPEEPAAIPSGGDPKLVPGRPFVLSSGPGRSTYHACGSLAIRYDKPLRTVTVEAEVDGVRGEPVTYEGVAPNSSIRYSVPLPGEKVAEAQVKIIAVGAPAAAGTIGWPIAPTDVSRGETLPDGKVVWSGSTRNPLSTPAKEVMIYCDFFFAEGIQAGSAVGKVTGNGIVGAGKKGYFRVVSEDASLANCEVCVARAVGQEY